jgi:hypothetical protein
MGLARVPRSRCARWATGWLVAGLGWLSGAKAVSRSDRGSWGSKFVRLPRRLPTAPFPKEPDPPGPPGLLGNTRRRFDPSSSRSAIVQGRQRLSSVESPKNPKQTETF